jgi:hypothetical protein
MVLARHFGDSIYMNHWLYRALLVLASFIYIFPFVALAQATEDRIAFIIGNGAYPKASALKNPLNDATAIEKQLSSYGFETKTYKDLKVAEVSGLRQQMESRIKRNSVLFFYYAGHGVQIDGRNYLMPVDANLNDGDKASQESLYLGDVLHAIERMRPKIAVVILDACRDNPFKDQKNSLASKQGLARVDPPSSTVVFYATRPGGTAQDGDEENGVFTKALLQEIVKPEQPLEVLFRRVSTAVYKNSKGDQEPWVEGVIREEFVLTRKDATPSPVVTPVIAQNQTDANTKPAPTLELPQISRPIHAAPPISIAQLQAIRSLSSLDMKAETLNTKFFCEDGNCSDYEALYKTMFEQKKFPNLFTPIDKIELCEFDLNAGACKEPVLNHGRGFNPLFLFQALFGTRVVTRNLMITQARKTNGGGISFSAEPTVYIERLKLGNENASKCSQNPGRIELMSNQLEFEISSSICIAATPPIPGSYKLTTDVLAYDHTNKDFYVRWKSKIYSFGLYQSSDGVAKLSLR